MQLSEKDGKLRVNEFENEYESYKRKSPSWFRKTQFQ